MLKNIFRNFYVKYFHENTKSVLPDVPKDLISYLLPRSHMTLHCSYFIRNFMNILYAKFFYQTYFKLFVSLPSDVFMPACDLDNFFPISLTNTWKVSYLFGWLVGSLIDRLVVLVDALFKLLHSPSWTQTHYVVQVSPNIMLVILCHPSITRATDIYHQSYIHILYMAINLNLVATWLTFFGPPSRCWFYLTLVKTINYS